MTYQLQKGLCYLCSSEAHLFDFEQTEKSPIILSKLDRPMVCDRAKTKTQKMKTNGSNSPVNR